LSKTLSSVDLMADIHCHLLPGVDDGSKSVEQSTRVLDVMAQDSIGAVCLTPHLSVADLAPSRFEEHLREYDNAYDQLMLVAPPLPTCHRGVELMVDRELPSDAVINSRITLAGSRYLLIEFPRDLSALAIRALVREIASTGFVPLIAHPERYAVATPGEVFLWRDLGARTQVDATTLAQEKGARAERARAIVEAGFADVLAADNHGDNRSLATASRYLHQNGGGEHAEYLLRQNPYAVLNDEALEPVPPINLTQRRWARVSRFFGS
jgi:protein-tyrosine phosphatase